MYKWNNNEPEDFYYLFILLRQRATARTISKFKYFERENLKERKRRSVIQTVNHRFRYLRFFIVIGFILYCLYIYIEISK